MVLFLFIFRRFMIRLFGFSCVFIVVICLLKVEFEILKGLDGCVFRIFVLL